MFSYSELQMLGKIVRKASSLLFATLVMSCLIGSNAVASIIEYKVDLFGPGFIAKWPYVRANLESQGTIRGKFEDGTLSDITGETSLLTITDGYIESGYHKFDNYIFATFKDNDFVPDFFKNKDVFSRPITWR